MTMQDRVRTLAQKFDPDAQLDTYRSGKTVTHTATARTGRNHLRITGDNDDDLPEVTLIDGTDLTRIAGGTDEQLAEAARALI